MKGCKILVLLVSLIILTPEIRAQSIFSGIPKSINTSDSFLFYLHGGIVQETGIPAVSEYYGRYEYLAILDTLSQYDLQIISEVRPKGTEVKGYALKLSHQVDSLLKKGVPDQNIIIVGASLGAYMALESAHLINNPKINYVVIGLCSEYAVKYFAKYQGNLQGNFLSIFENSDAKSSCNEIFKNMPPAPDPALVWHYQEIELNMGIDHSFLYKPYDEWVIPMMSWIKKASE